MNLCAVLTHTSAYSTWPPVTCGICEAEPRTCTITDHAQSVQTAGTVGQMAEKEPLPIQESCVPSFVPTEHDPG